MCKQVGLTSPLSQPSCKWKSRPSGKSCRRCRTRWRKSWRVSKILPADNPWMQWNWWKECRRKLIRRRSSVGTQSRRWSHRKRPSSHRKCPTKFGWLPNRRACRWTRPGWNFFWILSSVLGIELRRQSTVGETRRWRKLSRIPCSTWGTNWNKCRAEPSRRILPESTSWWSEERLGWSMRQQSWRYGALILCN